MNRHRLTDRRDAAKLIDYRQDNRVDAVVKGVEQIQYPILMGTLTTVFAFMPMAIFLQGQTQEYVFSIPAVVSNASHTLSATVPGRALQGQSSKVDPPAKDLEIVMRPRK